MSGFNRKEYSGFKGALTRAVKAKNWRKVLEVCKAVETVFEAPNGPPWPDDWSRWERAREDAELELRRAGGAEHFSFNLS